MPDNTLVKNEHGVRIIPINPLKGDMVIKIDVTGFVISEHVIKLPSISDLVPSIEGTNVPEHGDDIGTPDYYLFDNIMQLENKAMKINFDIYNVTEDEAKFSISVSYIQQGIELFIYKLDGSKIKKESMVNFYFWSKFIIEV